MRFAEELDIQGNLDPESTGEKYTGVVQTSKYICKGEGIEKWEPRFTYHGFRYVEVSGLDQIDENSLTGIVIYSSFKKIGSFNCSEENINKLHPHDALFDIKASIAEMSFYMKNLHQNAKKNK